MRMPGFTAEAAVLDGGGGLTYGMAGAMDAPATGAVVAPQALFCNTFLNRCLGPVCVNVRCCALPPGCCVRVSVAGITVLNRCFP
jgi:hypothetical protein